jgi:hypothetical protein
MQILDLNGVPVWNGFRSFSGSPAFSRLVSRKVIQSESGGNDGSIKKARLAETAFSYVLPLDAQAEAEEVRPAHKSRQTPPKLGSRQAKMLAENKRLVGPYRPTLEAERPVETDGSNPLEKHYTTDEIAAAWSVHPVTVYRDFVDEKGVVKLGSASTKRRTRRELRIPESVLMRVYSKRRT